MTYSDINLEGSKILIVDDMPANIELMIEFLEPANYSLAIAKSGRQALELLPRLLPDLILLDLRMPELDGFEVCRIIKDDPNPAISNTPVIFVTANTDLDAVLKGFGLGAVDYIYKPVQEPELQARVKTHLRHIKLYKEREILLAEQQAKNEKIAAILECVSDAIFTVDQNGVIKSINAAGIKLFEYQIEEIINSKVTKIIKEITINKFLDTSKKTRELTGVKKSGKEFFMDVSVRKMVSDHDLYVCIMHDITSHKEIQKKLEIESDTDPLTQLYNRRMFDRVISKVWKQAYRDGKEFSIIMLDIDYFKRYNDNYGHNAGDIVLKQVAKVLRNVASRPEDLAVRMGGEEFLLLLPVTDMAGVKNLSNKLMREIKRLKIEHEYSEVSDLVTVSIGAATCKPVSNEDLKIKQLLEFADTLMYKSKQNGRNQFHIDVFSE